VDLTHSFRVTEFIIFPCSYSPQVRYHLQYFNYWTLYTCLLPRDQLHGSMDTQQLRSMRRNALRTMMFSVFTSRANGPAIILPNHEHAQQIRIIAVHREAAHLPVDRVAAITIVGNCAGENRFVGTVIIVDRFDHAEVSAHAVIQQRCLLCHEPHVVELQIIS
jgi:hypothetical protein